MPTYQYACTACDHKLEAVQSFADDPLTECPVCQGRLRKLFGSVGIVFKGSGFYRTDSRAAPNGKNGSGDGEKKQSSGEGSAEKGTESKSSGSEKSSDKQPSGDSGSKDKTPATTTTSSS